MGNESSTVEVPPEEGSPTNVVAFPPEETQSHTEAQRDDRAPLTDALSSQQSLLSQLSLPDVPIITGVEEPGGVAGNQEDREELEFPHDLLPSLDFSSELNIWESSLGSTQTSSGERKCEQVTPLLADLQHHTGVSQPTVVLETRPRDSDADYTDVLSPPQSTATPPPSVLLDPELQEAFQECEQQMASLGIHQDISTTPETVNDLEKKTGEAMVNMSNESSSLSPIVVQSGHSNLHHGNKSAHGKSETPNRQLETLVFSFRNYILGTGEEGEGNKLKTTQNQDECPEVMPEKEHIQSPTAANIDFKDFLLTKQSEDVKSNSVSVGANTVDLSQAIEDKHTYKITEMSNVNKENQSEESDMNTFMIKDYLIHETSECSTLHLRNKQTQEDTRGEEGNEFKSLKQANLEKDNEVKKEEKKRQNKKESIDMSLEMGQKAQNEQPGDICTGLQFDSQTVICGGNGFGYTGQLSPRGDPGSSPPLSAPQSQQDHFTATACSSASEPDLSQQSDNHSHTKAYCGMNHSSSEVGGSIDIHQNAAVTYVQIDTINPAAAQTQEPAVTPESERTVQL
ncbi:uncharacterized protein LOC117522948 [Thalassophryne amazonica]|uniref:uncharacterized protein LOC117522948 n=1 Tax=Thalassophryne amazonica TaxID=390379 RepID=UPI001471E07F|nr:uncharacterized protein LOC117522948 [Thalassophryne amazonica]